MSKDGGQGAGSEIRRALHVHSGSGRNMLSTDLGEADVRDRPWLYAPDRGRNSFMSYPTQLTEQAIASSGTPRMPQA